MKYKDINEPIVITNEEIKNASKDQFIKLMEEKARRRQEHKKFMFELIKEAKKIYKETGSYGEAEAFIYQALEEWNNGKEV